MAFALNNSGIDHGQRLYMHTACLNTQLAGAFITLVAHQLSQLN
jgi:hypothetical protein